MSELLTRSNILVTPESRSLFSTSVANSGFSRLDVAVARVLIKRLIRSGLRKGPSDMLLLSDSALESWYDDDAVSYLHETAAKRKAAQGVIEIK